MLKFTTFVVLMFASLVFAGDPVPSIDQFNQITESYESQLETRVNSSEHAETLVSFLNQLTVPVLFQYIDGDFYAIFWDTQTLSVIRNGEPLKIVSSFDKYGRLSFYEDAENSMSGWLDIDSTRIHMAINTGKETYRWVENIDPDVGFSDSIIWAKKCLCKGSSNSCSTSDCQDLQACSYTDSAGTLHQSQCKMLEAPADLIPRREIGIGIIWWVAPDGAWPQ